MCTLASAGLTLAGAGINAVGESQGLRGQRRVLRKEISKAEAEEQERINIIAEQGQALLDQLSLNNQLDNSAVANEMGALGVAGGAGAANAMREALDAEAQARGARDDQAVRRVDRAGNLSLAGLGMRRRLRGGTQDIDMQLGGMKGYGLRHLGKTMMAAGQWMGTAGLGGALSLAGRPSTMSLANSNPGSLDLLEARRRRELADGVAA